MIVDTLPSLRRLLDGLSWWQKTDYLMLALMSVALVCNWSLALIVLYAMIVMSVVRRITQPADSMCRMASNKYYLWLLVAFAAFYWISLLFSTNVTEGVEVAIKKLPFVLLPLYFFLSDHTYMDRTRLRGLLWVLVLALCVRFEIRLIIAIVLGIKDHFSTSSFFFGNFDPFHHSYLSMYIVLALMFLYTELKRSYFHLSKLGRWLMVVAAIELTLYLVMIQSRAGILMFIFMIAYILFDISILQKHYRMGLIIMGASLLLGIGCVALFPHQTNRLGNTVKEVAEGNHDDARFGITETALLAISDNMPWGVGVGDRIDVMHHYFLLAHPKMEKAHYNPHNQYNDTLLTIGVLGLLLLIFMLVAPLIYCKRTHYQVKTMIYALVLIVACSCLFESIFERQMGILFFAFYVGLIGCANACGCPISNRMLKK